MAGYYPTRKPTFLWQAVLILLPVLLLAVVGFFSLRQDKLLVQHEAAERAQTLAGNLVALVWGELTVKAEGFESRAFKVDSTGQLVFPPASAPVPDPQSFKSAPLNLRQKDLWLAAQHAEAEAADPERTSTAFRDLLNSAPPEGIAASAHFSLGLLLMKQGNSQAAAVEFQQIVDGYPAAVGESWLQRALAEKPDLLLLDIMMPWLDGYAVCAELRRLSNPAFPARRESNWVIVCEGKSLSWSKGKRTRSN